MKHKFKYYRNSLGRRYCTIRYLDSSRTLMLVWKGTAPQKSIEQVEAGLLAMLKKYDCLSILNDVQELFNAPSEFLADLTKNVWDRKVVSKAGVRLVAHVLHPESELPEPIAATTTTPEVRFFRQKIDALEWVTKYAEE